MAKTSVKVEIVGDASKLKKATDEAEGVLGGFGDKLKGFGAGLIAGFGVDRIGGFANDAIQMASGIGESLNKNSVVFKEGADQIAAAAKGAAKTVGLGEAAYLELAGTVGTLGKAAGLSGDELGDFGNELIARAGDIGSFNNAATSDVIEAWGAALRGEAEPMRRFGVLLDDATMRQKALEMGLIKSTKDALTPQQKALAANALIMEQTSDAAGDFARTSDGLANKQKILKAQLDNVKTSIGRALLPAFSAIVTFASDRLGPALQKIGAVAIPIFKEIVGGFKAFVAAFKAGDGDITSSGFPGFMERVAGIASKVFREISGGVRAFVAAFKAGDGDVTSSGFPGFMEKMAYYARLAFDWIKNVGIPAVVTAFHWLQQNVPPAVEAVRVAVMAVFNWIRENVVPVIKTVVAYVVEQFGNLVAWVQTNWPAISEAIGHVINAIWDVIQWLIKVAKAAWETWGDNLIAIVKKAWNMIREVIAGALGVVRGLIMTVVNLINGDWGKAWDTIKATLGAAWDAIFGLLRGAVGIVAEVLKAIWKPIENGLSQAWSGIQGIWSSILAFVGGLPGRIASAASGMWDGIKNSFRSAVNWIIGKWNSLQFTIGGGSFLGQDIPSLTLGTPDIPMLANGGIVNQPTIAMIGERGPEAVVPLRQGAVPGMGGGDTIVNNFYSLDPSASSRYVIDAIEAWERRNGRRFARAA